MLEGQREGRSMFVAFNGLRNLGTVGEVREVFDRGEKLVKWRAVTLCVLEYLVGVD